MTTSKLEGIKREVRLSQGVEELIAIPKRLGYKLAILSGAFQLFADHLKDRLGLDYAFGNQLEIRGTSLTGRITGEVIDAPQKAALLNWIADQEGIPLDQTVAIGDGLTMPSCSVRRDWELPTMPGRPLTGVLLGIS